MFHKTLNSQNLLYFFCVGLLHCYKFCSDADIDGLKKVIFVCIKNGSRGLLDFAVAILEARKIFKWKVTLKMLIYRRFL